MKLRVLGSALLAAALLPVSASAQNVSSDAGWTVSGNWGVLFTDEVSQLDDGLILGLGAGYRFGENWEAGVNLVKSELNAENGAATGDADLSGYHANLTYYLSNEMLQPYVSVGVGEWEFDYDNANKADESPWNIGVGAKIFFVPSWAVSAEVRNYQGDDTNDVAFTVGFSHLTGQSKSAPAVQPVAVVPRDSDGDGVVDSADRCPATPVGVSVSSNGCALDSDRDGVADYVDQCASSAPGALVNSVGCEEVETDQVAIELRVNFPFNSAAIPQSSESDIADVADFLKTYGTATAIIEGHTDNRGDDAYHQMLSEKRAKAVAARLVELGAPGAAIKSVGYGEVRPIADNNTSAGRAENRRVMADIEVSTK